MRSPTSILTSILLVLALGPASAARAQQSRRRTEPTPPAPPAAQPPEPTFDLEAEMRQGSVTLTADQVAAQAVASAPSIERARAAAQLAEAGADRALLAVLPRLDLSARYTRLSPIDPPQLGGATLTPEQIAAAEAQIAMVADPAARGLFQANLDTLAAATGFSFPVLLNQYALRATLSYPVSDLFFTILPAYRAADGFAEAQRIQLRAQQRTIDLQAREALYNYARARGAFLVARNTVSQAEAHRRDVAAFVEAGTAARVELMRVDAQLASARVATARAQAGLRVASFGLRTLIHRPIGEDIALGESITVDVEAPREDRDALVRRGLERRPELLALRRVIGARESLVSAQHGSQLPHLSVQGNVDYANPNQRIFPQQDEFRATWDVSAVLSWSPNDALVNGAAASEASAELAQARADLDALEDGVRLEVTQAYEQLVAARAAVEAARVGIQAAEENYRVRAERFHAGAAVSSDLIDAEAELSRARLDLVDSAIDLRIASVRLRRATGER